MKKHSLTRFVAVTTVLLTMPACSNDEGKSCSPSDCPKPAHAIEMTCTDDGQCQVKVCDANYKISADKLSCTANTDVTPDTCDPAKCTKPDHAVTMTCDADRCAVAQCDTGYHVSTDKQTCEDDTPPEGFTDTTTIPVCYNKTSKCLDNTLMTCQAGSWTAAKACGTQICDERANDCIDAPIDTSADDIVSDTPCDNTTEEFCDGETAHFCNEQGKMTTRDCSAFSTLSCKKMTNGNFVDCVATCDPDTWTDYTTCQGNYVEVHTCEETTDGNYHEFALTDDPCDYACHAGQCVFEGEAPVDGAPCTERFEKTCWNGDAYICRNGIITRTPCPDDESCAIRIGTAEPVCTKRCRNVSESIYACKTENGITRLDNTLCALATDAHYYVFSETDACKTSCNQGLCDREIPKKDAPCDPDTFEDVCFQNALYYCHSENHVVASNPCANQMCRYLHADYGFSATYAECVTPCTEGDEPMLSCVGKGAKAYETRYECTRGSDGTFYRFEFEKRCSEAGCDGNVCAE